MKMSHRTCILIAVLATLWVQLAARAQNGVPVGVILRITSPVYLKQATTPVPLMLDPKRDVLRKLYAGQSLRVGLGGWLKLQLSSGTREIHPSEDWFILESGKTLTHEQMKVAEALKRYGTPGGQREIGPLLLLPADRTAVFSPAQGSSVIPHQMVIRWNPPAKREKIEFQLQTEGGKKIWSQDGVDMAAGKLDSPAARKALADYQESGGQESIILIMTDPEANETWVTFSLLSKPSEQELLKQLTKWDQVVDPLVRALGRVYEYDRRRLLVESAAEFDAALIAAPESLDLISAAIEAHLRTGNYARAAELKRQLFNLMP